MVNAGLLSKGTTLSYIENGDIKTIAGVKSVPQIGNDPEKVDVTNLGSSKKRYVKGLQDVDNLEFNVIYKGENFKDIHRLVELDKTLEWLVSYPDGMTVKFAGEVMLKIDGVEVNAAVGFSIVIVVSDGPNIEFAKEPQRPTGLKASNIQFDQFNLSWSGSGLFRVYVDRQKVGETYNNTFTVKGLKPSTKHVVSVASASGINEVHTVPIEVTTTKLPKITKINVPQRLDLYVGETKQLDVSTVPSEAMRAYEHVNKAVLDNSIVKFYGDKVSGVKSVNDENLGRNLLKNSEVPELSSRGNFDITKQTNQKVSEWNCENAVLYKIKGTGKGLIGVIQDSRNNVILKDEHAFSSLYVKNVGKTDIKISLLNDYEIIKQGTSKLLVLDFKFFIDKGYLQLIFSIDEENDDTSFILWRAKIEKGGKGSEWTPAPEDGYSYTNTTVTFNDAEKSSAEFDIFVHERKRMTSPTESDTASFIL